MLSENLKEAFCHRIKLSANKVEVITGGTATSQFELGSGAGRGTCGPRGPCSPLAEPAAPAAPAPLRPPAAPADLRHLQH